MYNIFINALLTLGTVFAVVLTAIILIAGGATVIALVSKIIDASKQDKADKSRK